MNVDLHWSFGFIEISSLMLSTCSKIQKSYLHFTHAPLSSFLLLGRTNILLVNYESWWQHQMLLSELRHDSPSGRFSKSRGLSARVSFLSSPPLALFARSLILVPRSLLLNGTETLATQGILLVNQFVTQSLSFLTNIKNFQISNITDKSHSQFINTFQHMPIWRTW